VLDVAEESQAVRRGAAPVTAIVGTAGDRPDDSPRIADAAGGRDGDQETRPPAAAKSVVAATRRPRRAA
jgi:hypothetical protein